MSADESAAADEAAAAAEKQVEDFYFKHAKRGIVLSADDLREFSRREGLPFSPSRVRRLRYKFKYMARFAPYRKRRIFMGPSIDKLGNVMLDVGEFRKDLRVFNRQARYLLVGVDCLSQRLACVPMTRKTQKAWEAGIRHMLEFDFPFVTTLITDRDSAIRGTRFQREVKKKYGINWIHLRIRSKAHKAERMIRFLRSRLSQALLHNDEGDKNWLQHLEGILDDYNKRPIKRTRIRRRDAGKANYTEILRQKYGVRDPSALFNTSVVGSFSPRMAGKIFKFAPGDKVLLAVGADYTRRPPGGTFVKKSAVGNYGKKVYTVEKQFLKSNADLFLNVVYRIAGLQGLFYENELIPALFSEEEEALAPVETVARAESPRRSERRRAPPPKKYR